MQEKNPNQRQGSQGSQRRDEGQRQGAGTAVRDDEGWRGETGRGQMGRGEPGRDEMGREEGREERSRSFYANALRRLRERSPGQGSRNPSFEERRTGFGAMGYGGGYYEPEWGRGSYGQESRERWGEQEDDWRSQQARSSSGFPQGRGYGQGWTDETSGGYGDQNRDRQARAQDWRTRELGQQDWQHGGQQDWRQRDRESGQQDWQRTGQHGMSGRQPGTTYGQSSMYGETGPMYGQTQGQQPFGQQEERHGRMEGPVRHGEAERSRWGGWAVPFFGGRQARRTHWKREPYTVRDVMTKDPECVTPATTVRDAARLMKDENVGALPAVDDKRKLQGIVTDRDLVVRVLAEDRQMAQVRVEEIMTRDVEAVTEDEAIHDVLDLMGRKQVRRLAVVDEQDRLIGMVSISDIAQKADYDEDLQEALERISSRRSFWSRLWT